MKRLVIAFTLLSIVAQGQERSLPPQKVIPQSSPGTVTLTLSRKGKTKNITVNGLGKIQSDR